MKLDVDYLVSLMERYTTKSNNKELGEQDAINSKAIRPEFIGNRINQQIMILVS